MRRMLTALIVLGAGLSGQPAQADPYQWCAVYSGVRGGAENCYFVTLEQCRATVSGAGGFCRVNTFYDGQPVRIPGESQSQRRPRRTS